MADRWPGLELRHFMALRAVAEERSFHGAAARLGYTQSAISQQIGALERIVGQRLIERPRGRQRVSVTEAGRLMLEHAEAIAARIGAAQADLAALAGGSAGVLRIGTYQSVGARILPDLLRAFVATRPAVEIRLTESQLDMDLLALLERGELDVAFVDLPLPPGPFEAIELIRDPYVLVVQADSPLAASATPPTLLEIARLPLICFKTCRSFEQILAQVTAQGVTPDVVFRSDQNDTLQGVAAAGMGVALMPRLSTDPDNPRTVIVDIGNCLPPRLIAAAWHSERRRLPAAEAFIEFARATLQRAESPRLRAPERRHLA